MAHIKHVACTISICPNPMMSYTLIRCRYDIIYLLSTVHETHFIYLMLMYIIPFVLSIKVLFISIKESKKMKMLTKSDVVNVYLDFVVNLKVDGRYNNQ